MQEHEQRKQLIGLTNPTLSPASTMVEKVLDELFVGNVAIDPHIPKIAENQGLVGILERNLTACIEWAKQLVMQPTFPKGAQNSITAYINALTPLRNSLNQLNRYLKSVYGSDRNGQVALESLVNNFENLRIFLEYTMAEIRYSKEIDPNALDVFVGIMPKETKKKYEKALQSIEPLPAYKSVAPGQTCKAEASIVQFLTKLSLLMRELLKAAPDGSPLSELAKQLLKQLNLALDQRQAQQANLESHFCQKNYRKKEYICKK